MSENERCEDEHSLMNEVVDFAKAYNAYFTLGLSMLSIILLICCISLSRRISKLNRRRSASLVNGNIEEIVNCLTDQSSAITELEDKLKDVNNRQVGLGRDLSNCIQKLGIVRFNAYDDVGGEQSFALVLLDCNKNGVAISSLYGRQDTRFYAKRIVNGETERSFSDEERSAFEKAMAGQELAARV
jgi:hypothetical protein